MTRDQLEHVIRAAGAIAEVNRIVMIGSQAILGFDPDPSPELLVSMEADVYPPDHLERADLSTNRVSAGFDRPGIVDALTESAARGVMGAWQTQRNAS